MRYSVMSSWLKKPVITEQDLHEANFTYDEINFIAGFSIKTIAKNEPILLQYFEEVR